MGKEKAFYVPGKLTIKKLMPVVEAVVYEIPLETFRKLKIRAGKRMLREGIVKKLNLLSEAALDNVPGLNDEIMTFFAINVDKRQKEIAQKDEEAKIKVMMMESEMK